MLRARHENVGAALVVMTLVTGWAGSARPAGNPAVAAGPAPPPFSPTKVLADLEQRRGNVSFASADSQVARPDHDRSAAPYLMVVGEGTAANGTEQVPLKETSADVSIAGVIARVRVHQLFENGGRVPIEAVYVFPASTRAAVHGVRMKIGARVVEARIDKRQAARDSYDSARREGRRASLLEQDRPNVFTMNVANIMPGDRIAVELDYSEMLVPEDAVYELVYPTVVGPRYAGGADPSRDKWIANPHLPAGTPEPYRFDIRVHLETGIAIKELSSPSHAVRVDYAAANRADVRLAAPGGGNRDFVLRYRLAGDKIETGLLLWDGQSDRDGDGANPRRESFFALMMEPPRRPTAAQIPVREYIFLLDVSGSMHGFPLDTAKALMRNLLGRLRPTDQFNVVLFSGAAHVMSPQGSLPARPDEIARAIADVERQHGGGGTELMGGLESCYRIPKRDARASRTVVVVTDGYVGVEAQAFRFIRQRLSDANLFAFGIGSSVNRGLIEGMARAGQGEPFIVLAPDRAAEQADKLRAYIEQPVLTGINVTFDGFDAYEVAPQKLPDLMARRPLVLFGKYRGAPRGRIEISGTGGAGRVHHAVEVRAADARSENGALRWLWARRWVATLEDERAMGAGEAAEAGITALGLDYHLLTAFTSFVAVDHEVVNAGGDSQSVRQPLPMPEGVSNLAVAEAPASMAPPSPSPSGNSGARLYRKAARASEVKAEEGLDARVASAGKEKRPVQHAAGAAATAAANPAKDDERSRAGGWIVNVGNSASLTDTAPLAAAIRRALAASGGACAAGGARPSLTLRLTVDARGKIQRIDVLQGDSTAAACLRKLLSAISSSATVSSGGAARGTVDVVISRAS
jgi:Ca-activated chloride channel family protein